MKILTLNHKYELANVDHPEEPGQVVQFIEKSPQDLRKIVNDGTTTEEVLRMLIDRFRGMGEKLVGREYYYVIRRLEESLLWAKKEALYQKIDLFQRAYDSLDPSDPYRKIVAQNYYAIEGKRLEPLPNEDV